MTDSKVLKHAEFVAAKFARNHEGWVYSRNRGGLKHIRYEHDTTGYNHWTRRLRRAVRAWNPITYVWPKESIDRMFKDSNPTVRKFFIRAWAGSQVALCKDKNLPDGQINGIITHWEEDGEYIALFQPRVGMKVLGFIRANPDNEHAQAILAEMEACSELSWPTKKEDA